MSPCPDFSEAFTFKRSFPKFCVAGFRYFLCTLLFTLTVNFTAYANSSRKDFSNKVLGDPFGARNWLYDKGVDLTLTYLSETLANVAGGRRSGMDYSHQVTMGVDVDLEKLLGAKGLSFRMLGVQRAGRDVAKDYISHLTLFEPQQDFGVGGNVIYRLVQLYAQQKLAHNRVIITAGYYPPNMSFGSFPLGCYALDNVTCAHPTGVSVSSHWRSWPFAELGAQVEFDPTKDTYARVGLFQATKKDGGHTGFYITTSSLGIVIPIELGWNPHWGESKLPGHYKVGGYIDTSDNKDLYTSVTGAPIATSKRPARLEPQRGAWYIGGDQMLYRFGPGERDGLMAFGIVTGTSGTSVPFRHDFSAGLIAQHIIPSRPADYVSIFWSELIVNPYLTKTQELQMDHHLALQNGVKAIETYTEVLEVNYGFQFSNGIKFVPDCQIIFRPDAARYYKDALIVGFRFQADL